MLPVSFGGGGPVAKQPAQPNASSNPFAQDTFLNENVTDEEFDEFLSLRNPSKGNICVVLSDKAVCVQCCSELLTQRASFCR